MSSKPANDWSNDRIRKYLDGDCEEEPELEPVPAADTTIVRRVSGKPPVILPDGSIGRASTFTDGTFETESWDAGSKSWVRGGIPMTSLNTAPLATAAELSAAGVPPEPIPYTVKEVFSGPFIWLDGYLGREVITTNHRLVREVFDPRIKTWVEQFFSGESRMMARPATPEDLAREGVPT